MQASLAGVRPIRASTGRPVGFLSAASSLATELSDIRLFGSNAARCGCGGAIQ